MEVYIIMRIIAVVLLAVLFGALIVMFAKSKKR